MGDTLNRTLATAMLRILKPLVRILLRNGLPYGVAADLVRRSYVDVAWQDFAPRGRKQTVSRVSALTGLTRKEVKRLVELGDAEDMPDQSRYSRATRVISGWLLDRQFHDSAGRPAVLPLDGTRNSFAVLVRQYSGDIPARAMQDMLAEAGSIRVTGDKVRLVRHAYVPASDSVEKIGILGTDVAELIATIDHNLVAAPDMLRFQRKVACDNIDPAAVARLRSLAARKAQSLLESLDREFAKYQQDEQAGTGGSYLSLGIYFHEHQDNGRNDPE
jgi:hypothetical protein